MPEEKSPYIQDYYAENFAWCYGCGRLNPHGLHFKTRWEGEETVTRYMPRPEHTAIPGFVYGGLLASLADCHTTGSGALALHKAAGHLPEDGVEAPRCVTASLKVDFLKPTPAFTWLEARGRIVEAGARKVVVATEIWADGQLVVRAEGVAVRVPDTMKGGGSA